MVNNFLIPTIVDKTPSWERAYDIYSRLLEDRIKAPITMYINSPGWHVTAGLAIYDTMQYISCPVHTVSLWLSASMWAIVLVWWEKWKRFALPHSEIMIHQPLGWAEWQMVDIKLAAEHIVKTWDTLYKIIAKHTGQDVKKVEKDCDRDNFMSAEEALEYWIIDKIIK